MCPSAMTAILRTVEFESSDIRGQSLAEQPRSVRAFFHQLSRFRRDACVLRCHSFFTFEEGVHVPKRKVRISFVLPANRQINCRSRTEQQYQCWKARVKRKAHATECQDTRQTTNDESNFALSKKDKTEKSCHKEAQNGTPIVALI